MDNILRRLTNVRGNRMEFIDKDSLYYIFLEILRFHHMRTHGLLNEIGIYPGQPPMLFILFKGEGLSQRELGEKLKLTPATITVMLKRMEKANIVERRQDKDDQRIWRVYLTEKGEKMYYKAREATKVIDEECFGNFNMEEKAVLKKLMLQMRDNLKKVIED